MKEIYDREVAKLEAIRLRSGAGGNSEPLVSAFDQVNVGIATPQSIWLMEQLGGLSSDEAEKLSNLAEEVGKEISRRSG